RVAVYLLCGVHAVLEAEDTLKGDVEHSSLSHAAPMPRAALCDMPRKINRNEGLAGRAFAVDHYLIARTYEPLTIAFACRCESISAVRSLGNSSRRIGCAPACDCEAPWSVPAPDSDRRITSATASVMSSK